MNVHHNRRDHALQETADERRVPYQHPQPQESPPEIVIPDAIPADERLWVPQAENVWFRPLCLSASRGYWQNLLRVRKSGVLSRHRHPQPVHGFVLKGSWRYLSTTGSPLKAPMFTRLRRDAHAGGRRGRER
jgi:hypothetical protein